MHARAPPRECHLDGCAMCGALGPGFRSESSNHAYRALFCNERCARRYWVIHDHNRHCHEAMGCWTHTAKCLFLERLHLTDCTPGSDLDVTVSVSIKDGIDGGPPAKEPLNEYTKYFRALEELKERLKNLSQTSKDQPIASWAQAFDGLMRNLDILYSDDFPAHFINHIVELNRVIQQQTAEDGSCSKEIEEVKNILGALVRKMPLNRDLYVHRDALKQLLKLDKYSTEKLVLTLDGGGMKGFVTLVVLKRLLELIRIRVKDPHVRLTDCFDLIIGTSTGSLITAAICVAGLELEDIEALYQTFGVDVFSKQNRTDGLRFKATSKYADYKMIRVLYKIFQGKRLDDPELRCEEEGGKLPRFGFVTTDISTTVPKSTLLRNYEVPAAQRQVGRTQGTSHCYVSEALRCSCAAPTIVPFYARYYAPITMVGSRHLTKGRCRYLEDADGELYTYERLLVDMLPREERAAAAAKQKLDELFEQKKVFADGGIMANNPAMLSLIEALYLWQQMPNLGVRVISCGTGVIPEEANRSWNPSIPRPAEQPLWGDKNIRNVVMDSLVHGFVLQACETEETAAVMERFGTQLAAYERLNPPLDKVILMDDVSRQGMEDLRRCATKWCDSGVGKSTLDRVAEAVVLSSERLHRSVTK